MRHAPPGVECTVLTTAAHADRFAGPVRVVESTVHGDGASLREELADLRPDLVQVNLVDPASMVSALEAAAEHGPAPATLHMRGEVPDLPRLRCAYAGLTALVAVSVEFAAFARDALGVAGVVHVLNGVDPLELVSPPGGDIPVVGALGRLTAQKGFDVLLEAVRLLVTRGSVAGRRQSHERSGRRFGSREFKRRGLLEHRAIRRSARRSNVWPRAKGDLSCGCS